MGREQEFLAFCPKCKTFETVWVKGRVLVKTKRFRQKADGEVYHDCGDAPCLLLPVLFIAGVASDRPRMI